MQSLVKSIVPLCQSFKMNFFCNYTIKLRCIFSCKIHARKNVYDYQKTNIHFPLDPPLDMDFKHLEASVIDMLHNHIYSSPGGRVSSLYLRPSVHHIYSPSGGRVCYRGGIGCLDFFVGISSKCPLLFFSGQRF